MMTIERLRSTIFLIAGAALAGACLASAAEHDADVRAWQQERIDALTAPTSYLSIIDLHWLSQGTTTIGSDDGADIRLPADAPASVGVFDFDGETVTLRVTHAAGVTIDDLPVGGAVVMEDDTSEAPVTARVDRYSWTIIERNGRHAVRIRDHEHPILDNFGPLPYYPISEDFRVEGRLKRYEEPKVVRVGTVIEGLGWEPLSPGVVEFTLDGETFSLEAYASTNDRLFFVFGDRTNRDETYPAGRFLYADDPGDGDVTVLDFNKAYSPPCAFNDFSTCPVATPRNRLPIAIPAGERYDKSFAPPTSVTSR